MQSNRYSDLARAKYYVEFKEPPRGQSGIAEGEQRAVSFVIPTLNNESTIDAALSSFAMQDYPRKELIVVDGGSSDGTLDISGRYADAILRVPGPCGLAVLRGIERAQGDFIALFDSDSSIPKQDLAVRCDSDIRLLRQS